MRIKVVKILEMSECICYNVSVLLYITLIFILFTLLNSALSNVKQYISCVMVDT